MPIDPKLRERLSKIGTFEGSVENVERKAVKILKDAGLPIDGTKPVADNASPEWYTQEVVWRIGRVREMIRRVDQREEGATADQLAVEAMQLDHAIWTAVYKVGLEANTAAGAGSRRGGSKGNQGRIDSAELKHDPRLAAFNRAVADGLPIGRAEQRAASECHCSTRTIRAVRTGK